MDSTNAWCGQQINRLHLILVTCSSASNQMDSTDAWCGQQINRLHLILVICSSASNQNGLYRRLVRPANK
jgi:hypothetical protein